MWRGMAVGTCLALLVVGVVSGQGQRSPATLNDLLAEMRGLRADVNQSSSATVRAQLLVGRLQLQEARINTLGRDLTDIRQRLTGQTTALARLREELIGSKRAFAPEISLQQNGPLSNEC